MAASGLKGGIPDTKKGLGVRVIGVKGFLGFLV